MKKKKKSKKLSLKDLKKIKGGVVKGNDTESKQWGRHYRDKQPGEAAATKDSSS
jgi:hypothetical protein